VSGPDDLAAHLLATCRALFAKQKALADGAVAQCSDDELHRVPGAADSGANSIAITMKHIAGNLRSRWTDFLTSDGEKPWRDRDTEFIDDGPDRSTLLARWDEAWAVLFQTLDGLTPADLMRTVAIRAEPHTVVQALLRQVSHYGYHVGQIVSGARALVGVRWRSLSVPRGGSVAYNQSMMAAASSSAAFAAASASERYPRPNSPGVRSMDRPAPAAHPIHELIAKRWSPRAFADSPVDKATLARLFEAARWAPSSFNAQPWEVFVATKDDAPAYARLLGLLVEGNQAWAKAAPVLMIWCTRTAFPANGKPNRHGWHDAGLALGNLLVQATALGLVGHAMAGIKYDDARTTLALPADVDPVCGFALGHPGDAATLPEPFRTREAAPRERKPITAFVHRDALSDASPVVK
jgi:nitroreductase